MAAFNFSLGKKKKSRFDLADVNQVLSHLVEYEFKTNG